MARAFSASAPSRDLSSWTASWDIGGRVSGLDMPTGSLLGSARRWRRGRRGRGGGGRGRTARAEQQPRRIAVEIVHGATDIGERAAAIRHQGAGSFVEILSQFTD